jgi:formate hydrogenlyase subunit 6/NADH:ubiquinone oxidoreductase subunit I
MTPIALKWAFKKPVTTRYPFEPRQAIEGSRGSLTFDTETCVYCGVCGKKCPTGALTINRKGRKWSIDRLLCITCGYCVDACPKKSLALETPHATPTVTRDREFYSSPEKQQPKADVPAESLK